MKHSANNKKFYFEIHIDVVKFTDLNYRFYFDLIDEKGEILLKSISYTYKIDCQKVIKSVLRNSTKEDRFKIEPLSNGKFRVYLRAVNGEIIAESPNYLDTKEEAINLIKNLKNLSLKTPVIDKTKTMKDSNNNKKFFFEIDKNKDNFFSYFYDRFYFKLKDEEEGKIYLKSDLYTNKTDSQNWINSVIRNSKNEDRFGVIQTYEEKWIFYLRNENGQIIAVSPYYFDTIVEAINLIKNLKNLSLKTPVIDNTKIKN